MSMSCMLQPPVTSLPPMAPAPGSADHVVSGARSGRQVLPLAAAGFWTRLAGHEDDDSCPRDPGTPRWRRACSGECTCRARGLALGGWRVVLGDEAEVRAFSTRPISFPPLPRPSIIMPHGCCALSERPGRPLPSSAPPTGAQTRAESPSQRKGQLAGLAHAVSRARTGSRGAPGPSRRPAASRRPTRGA